MAGSTDIEIMHLIKVIHLQIEGQMNEYMKGYGLTAAQMDVLQHVLYREEDTVMISTDVHRQMYLSKANISNIMKKLRGKGYLEFEPNPMDDRKKRILVTEKARRLDLELDGCFGRVRDRIYENFTPSDLSALKGLLDKLLLNLRPDMQVGKERIW